MTQARTARCFDHSTAEADDPGRGLMNYQRLAMLWCRGGAQTASSASGRGEEVPTPRLLKPSMAGSWPAKEKDVNGLITAREARASLPFFAGTRPLGWVRGTVANSNHFQPAVERVSAMSWTYYCQVRGSAQDAHVVTEVLGLALIPVAAAVSSQDSSQRDSAGQSRGAVAGLVIANYTGHLHSQPPLWQIYGVLLFCSHREG